MSFFSTAGVHPQQGHKAIERKRAHRKNNKTSAWPMNGMVMHAMN